MSAPGPRQKLAVVNGLRGIAILGVLYQHLLSHWTPPGWLSVKLAGLRIPLSAPLSNGWLGVDLFFVLSGFVLFLPYCTGERSVESRSDWWTFYRRRFVRLMPLYYFSLLVAVAWVYRPNPLRVWEDLFLMGTATFSFTARLSFPPYNWVLWSLGLEIWFSVLFPLLVWLHQRTGLARLASGALILGLVTRALGEIVYPQFPNPRLNPLKDSLPGRLDEFVLGMVICALFVRHGPLAPKRATGVLGLGLLGVYAAGTLWDGVLIRSFPGAVVPFINVVLMAGMFGVVYGMLSIRPGLIRTLITSTPLQVTGMMCYSLYVWHSMIQRGWFMGVESPGVLHYVGYFALTFAVSAMTYRYIEFSHRRDWRTLFRGSES